MHGFETQRGITSLRQRNCSICMGPNDAAKLRKEVASRTERLSIWRLELKGVSLLPFVKRSPAWTDFTESDEIG